MECFFVGESDVNLADTTLTLRGDEARHAVRVLRISEGEHLAATTLDGTYYKATCLKSGQPSKNQWLCECKIDEMLPDHNEPTIDIELIQAIPLSQSTLEEIAEKVTEIGISSLTPVFSKRTEKKTINKDRIEKILQNASKQAHRARKPILSDICNLSEALQGAKNNGRTIILLHESAPLTDSLPRLFTKMQYKKLSLVIGPEGGFDEREVLLASASYEASVASLGVRRLRAETAAIMAVSIAISCGE